MLFGDSGVCLLVVLYNVIEFCILILVGIFVFFVILNLSYFVLYVFFSCLLFGYDFEVCCNLN